jgi:radical SAM superfamily enzyme YgiQ (UPF0313 family)
MPPSMNSHNTVMRRSRMRVICPAFPAFNIYSRPAKSMTALGPVCIATAVNDIPRWDAELVDENNYQRGPTDAFGRPDHKALQETTPADVVGFYAGLTSTIPRLYDIAREYKALGAMTIAGGHHLVGENIADALHNGVDIVVIGEGEETVGELLSCIDTGGDLAAIEGIAFLRDGVYVETSRRAPIEAFDELPLPDFSVLRHGRMKFYPVSGVRGCGMNCEFCTVKGKPRFASPERMLAQFASIYETRGGRVFFIVDDLFGQNRNETIRLCQMLRDYQDQQQVTFSIMVQIRLDRARDTELLEAMRQARINNLAIGFESPIAEELEAMDKHLDPQTMVAMAKTYRRAGFRIHGMFIFGYPAKEGQGFYMGAKERIQRFRRFIRQSGLDTVQVLLPIPLPGTELTQRLGDAGRIYSTEMLGWEYYDGNFPLIEPDAPLTAQDMQASIQKIMYRFYGVRHFLALLAHLVVVPAIAVRLAGIRTAWKRWRWRWGRTLCRCGGRLTLRQWSIAFRKNGFLRKLAKAQRV